MNHAHRAQRPLPRIFQTLLLLLALATTAACATSSNAAPPAPDLETQCDQLTAAGKFADAQALAQKAITADPKNPAAHYCLGLVFLEQNNHADATPPLEKAVALAPNVSKYHRALGDAHGLAALHASLFHKLALAKKCKAAYEKAVELDPASTHARTSLIRYLWEAPAIAGGGKDKAYAQIDALEKINPPAARAQRLAYCIKDKKFAEARALLAAGLAANPDDYRAHYQLGQLAEREGDTPAARAAYQAALALAPDFKEAKAALEKLQ